jgi:hypothetical protein
MSHPIDGLHPITINTAFMLNLDKIISHLINYVADFIKKLDIRVL